MRNTVAPYYTSISVSTGMTQKDLNYKLDGAKRCLFNMGADDDDQLVLEKITVALLTNGEAGMVLDLRTAGEYLPKEENP